ncbi:MAG: hypothetical protein V1837_04060 [Candidatus Woesearchaeota archaeon]
MPKKCIICGTDAQFQIKDTSDYYCDSCAKENFSDLELLEKVEEKARRVKKMLEEEEQ